MKQQQQAAMRGQQPSPAQQGQGQPPGQGQNQQTLLQMAHQAGWQQNFNQQQGEAPMNPDQQWFSQSDPFLDGSGQQHQNQSQSDGAFKVPQAPPAKQQVAPP